MNISRRDFIKTGCKIIIGAATGTVIIRSFFKISVAAENPADGEKYDWNQHYWGFVVDNNKCIGCGNEMGGILSHVAIVAREYGTPCVVNVREIIDALKDGEPLTVDGDEGKVYRGLNMR